MDELLKELDELKNVLDCNEDIEKAVDILEWLVNCELNNIDIYKTINTNFNTINNNFNTINYFILTLAKQLLEYIKQNNKRISKLEKKIDKLSR